MKLDEKKRRMIVIGIAVILILMGAIEGLFKIKLDRKIVDEISFVLMMVAAWLLLSGRKFGKSANQDPKKEANPQAENSAETPPDIDAQPDMAEKPSELPPPSDNQKKGDPES